MEVSLFIQLEVSMSPSFARFEVGLREKLDVIPKVSTFP